MTEGDTVDSTGLAQGSFEWHEWREKHANASEAPAVMGVGRFVPRNPRELSMVRNGSITIKQSSYMRQGQMLEQGAVEKLKAETFVNGKAMDKLKPLVLSAKIDGIPMSASLDAAQGEVWYEVKHVFSDTSPYWEAAVNGRIDPATLMQMTHQYIVAREHGFTTGFFHVVNKGVAYTVEYIHDEAREEQLMAAWKEVWPAIEQGKTFGEREDAGWRMAAEAWLSAKQAVDAAEKRLEDAKLALVALAGNTNTVGNGVSVTKVTRPGGYDYSKLPDDILKTLPKKPGVEYFTVKEAKQ